MNRRHASLIRAGMMMAIVAAWLFPFVRAWRLAIEASRVYAEESSIHAWNDYAYSRELLVSYAFSFLVAILLAWLLIRTRNWLLLLPLAACFALAVYVHWLRPERVIVLFSDIPPMRPAAFSAVIGLAALLMTRLYPRPRAEVADLAS